MKLRKLAALVLAGVMAMSMAACSAASVEGEKPAAEGEAADRTDITFLEYLPLFNADGTPQ